MRKKLFKKTEWTLIVCCFILIIISLIALFSATQNSDFEELRKQIIWIIAGIPIALIVAKIDYETIARLSPICYIIFIILLVVVFFTSAINGATSWFNIGGVSIQPRRTCKNIRNNICKYSIGKNTKR